MHIFGFLQQVASLVIVIDSRPLEYGCITHFEKIIPDFLQDYSYVFKELDPKLLQVSGPWLGTTIMLDNGNVHDGEIHCSLTGLMVWVESTPLIWFNCQQGAITSSTYVA